MDPGASAVLVPSAGFVGEGGAPCAPRRVAAANFNGLRLVAPHPRTLHLVDIENLLGEAHRGAVATGSVLDRYLAAAAWHAGDQTFVAGQARHVAAVSFDSPVPLRGLIAYPGKDGADRRLLETDRAERIAERFDRVVIGSGDGIFAELARTLRRSAVRVWVVSSPESLSRWLASAATRVVAFPSSNV